MVIWYILLLFGIFYVPLVYLLVIWYIVPVLVYCREKNLAILVFMGIDLWIFRLEFWQKCYKIKRFFLEYIYMYLLNRYLFKNWSENFFRNCFI
jgi:hypothetical protein